MIRGINFAQRLYSDSFADDNEYYLDEEERYYSENELNDAFLQGYQYAQSEFSDNSKKNKKISISEYSTPRGIGRSYILGNVPGVVGRHYGNKAADEADDNGDSEEMIVKKATHKGAKSGAITGAAIGGALGAGIGTTGVILGKKALKEVGMKPKKLAMVAVPVGYALTGAGAASLSGALGGSLGARKSAKVRLAKRNRDLVLLKDKED